MRKELEIIKHVIELYTGDTTDEAMANYELKNSEQVKMYAEAFRDYDLSDVLQAIDEFWNFKSSKTKPTVAQILAILNSKKEVEKDSFSVDAQASRFDESCWRYWVGIDLARALMIRAGNKNLRFWYQKAVDAILTERVARLPEARFWDYGRKVKECFERGFLMMSTRLPRIFVNGRFLVKKMQCRHPLKKAAIGWLHIGRLVRDG